MPLPNARTSRDEPLLTKVVPAKVAAQLGGWSMTERKMEAPLGPDQPTQEEKQEGGSKEFVGEFQAGPQTPR